MIRFPSFSRYFLRHHSTEVGLSVQIKTEMPSTSKEPQDISNDISRKTSSNIKFLSDKDPIVKKLFRPFIPQDFVSEGVDRLGKPIPPLISQSELIWLRHHAILFGLDPENDLNLPQISSKKEEPLHDQRRIAELAHYEKLRSEKEERRKERMDKQNLKSLLTRKITLDDLAEIEERAIENQPKHSNMPLHLKPKEEREAYRTQQLTTISRLMKDMPKKVEQWRIQQRLLRKQRRAQRKLN